MAYHQRSVDDFYATITQGLDKLEHLLLSPDFITIDFLLHALQFLADLHSNLVSFALNLHLPASLHSDGWLLDYLDQTVKILDVCHALKLGISGIKQYRSRIASVFRASGGRLNQALDACRDELQRIETNNKGFVASKFEADGNLRLHFRDVYVEFKFSKWNGLWGIMFAVTNVTAFLSTLLLWGVVYAGNSTSFRIESINFQAPWAASFLRLQQMVLDALLNARQMNNVPTAFLHEFVAVQPFMIIHRDDPYKLKIPQQQLRQLALKLSDVVKDLDLRVNDLLDVIVESRRKLLESCCGKAS